MRRSTFNKESCQSSKQQACRRNCSSSETSWQNRDCIEGRVPADRIGILKDPLQVAAASSFFFFFFFFLFLVVLVPVSVVRI